MQPYIELNNHHIGKSHVQNGLTCEDYSATYSDDHVNIIVISDGHGDKNCFRSAKGAQYACEIAINACRQFQLSTEHIDNIEQCDFESLVNSLESDIADMWKEKVLSDALVHPFSEEELSVASIQAQELYLNGQKHEKAYGCTLILAMSTTRYWLALQIGDGKCVAAYSDGVYVEPVPVDENCLGNRSTSLCNSNAKDLFRHYYSMVKPIAAFVSSDGVEESFDQAGLYNCFYSMAFWLKEEGYDAAKSKLESLLPQISDGGSGDDVSIAFMVSSESNISKPKQTLDQIYDRVNACANALEQCNARLADAKDRLAEQNNKCSSIEKEIAEIKARLEEKEKTYEDALSDKDNLKSTADELDMKAKLAAEQMEKASKYKASAERYWFSEFERLGLKYLPNDEDEPKAAPAETINDDSLNIQDEPSSTEEEQVTENSIPIENHREVLVEPVISEAQENKEIKESFSEEYHTPYAGVFEKLAQKEEHEETEKTPKRFWPFSKQPK